LAEKIVTNFGKSVAAKFGKSALRAGKISPNRQTNPALISKKISPDFFADCPARQKIY
jgi:hypothetical protein